MNHDNVLELKKPETFIEDPITEILHQVAKRLFAQALETEIDIIIGQYKDLTDGMGRQRILRKGYLPECPIQTGIGSVSVKAPRLRDRHADPAKRLKLSSSILTPYQRKTKSMEHLIPWLYLKGVSTGDFSDALAALVGKDAPGLSAD